jgi:hypothetical protein
VRVFWTCCFLFLGILTPGHADRVLAQAILVQVIEFETGQPIPGAFLTFHGADGTFVRNALTNSEGRFLFQAGNLGPFTIKAEMIGRETREKTGFTLSGPGETTLTLTLPVHAIQLEGVQIRAESRCQLRPENATTTAQVWEEARKALAVQQWAESERVLEFAMVSYSRDLHPQTLAVEAEQRRASRGVSRNPIQSLSPEVLARDGFVQPVDGGEYDYFGPDARVLLSDAFLDTHCLSVTQTSERPGSIGLVFEPVNNGETADIEGVFWLSTASWQLQFLEYGYTWSPYPESQAQARGRVEFEVLPNGAWVIRRWWIRMPMMARRHSGGERFGGTGLEVVGFREVGGEIEEVSTLNQVRLVEASWGTLTGTVWDSTAPGPLPGARVYLEGTGYSVFTDEQGHFELRGLPRGRFLAKFRHPRLDSINVAMDGAVVVVRPGTRTDLTMTIPSRETLATAMCDGMEAGPGTATLVGRVGTPSSGDPLPGVRIQVSWNPALGGRANGGRVDLFTVGSRIGLETATTPNGWYTACGVPAGLELEVLAEPPGGVTQTRQVMAEPGEILRLDFRVPSGG